MSQLYLTSSLIQNYSGDLNSLVALHELYKYINKYYDQVSVFPTGMDTTFSFYHPVKKTKQNKNLN